MAFPAVGHQCPLFGTKLLGDRGTCVSNLPKVVVGTWIDRESKPRESNVLTITETESGSCRFRSMTTMQF